MNKKVLLWLIVLFFIVSAMFIRLELPKTDLSKQLNAIGVTDLRDAGLIDTFMINDNKYLKSEVYNRNGEQVFMLLYLHNGKHEVKELGILWLKDFLKLL